MIIKSSYRSTPVLATTFHLMPAIANSDWLAVSATSTWPNTSTVPCHSHTHTRTHRNTLCFAHFKALLAARLAKSDARQSHSRQQGEQGGGQGNRLEGEGVALYCGNHKSCTFFCHSEPQSYNMSELCASFCRSFFNEESSERGSREVAGGGSGSARHIFFMFTADFNAYFRGIFSIFGVLATFYDCALQFQVCVPVHRLVEYSCLQECVCVWTCEVLMRQTDLRLGRKIKRTLRFNYASSSYQYKLLRRSRGRRRSRCRRRQIIFVVAVESEVRNNEQHTRHTPQSLSLLPHVTAAAAAPSWRIALWQHQIDFITH